MKRIVAGIAGALLLNGGAAAWAEDADATSGSGAAASAPAPSDDGLGGYFAHWFDRVREAQETQPHWITPIATVTPRLEQEFR